MARVTLYFVQSWRKGRGTRLVADTPANCKTPEAARRAAERLAPARAGVVAFATSGDSELGEYDEEPVILFRTGRLPAQFAEE